jgi:hypothetical protein
MSKFIKYDSTLTDVLTSGDFDNLELSGRPEFTGDSSAFSGTGGVSAFNTGNVYGGATNALSGQITFEGYNFATLTAVMLSCTNGLPLFTDSPSLTNFNFYNSITAVSTNGTPFSGLSAYYPEVSGFFTSNYVLNNYNSMSITFPTATATGIVDIIAINPAGYGKLSTDLGSIDGITIN